MVSGQPGVGESHSNARTEISHEHLVLTNKKRLMMGSS